MRQERFPTESQQAVPSTQSLSDALDLLFPEGCVPLSDFSARLAQLLSDLTAARAVMLFADTADGPLLAQAGGPRNDEAARKLAARATSVSGVYAEASWLATDLKTNEINSAIVVLDMSGANRLAVAMASERLELIRALCRASAFAQRFRPTPAFLTQATRIAAGDWENAQSFVDELSHITGLTEVGIVRIAGRKAQEIWFSGQAEVSHRSTLRQFHLDRVNTALVTLTTDRSIELLGAMPLAAILSSEDSVLPDSAAQVLRAVFTTPRRRTGFGRTLRTTALWSVPLLAIGAALMVPIAETINLPARVEATERRAVTAPFDGRVDEILVMDGDQVIADTTLLGRMDTTDIDRKLTELRTQQLVAISKRDAARGERKAADIRESELNIELLSVRIKAAEARLANASLYAPISGIIQIPGSPDKVGSFVGLGASLMEVIDPTRKRIIMDFDPRARSKISDQTTGQFRPDAVPIEVVDFELSTIGLIFQTPENKTHLGRSLTLEASETEFLIDGMQGVASFELGKQPVGLLIWKRLRDWAIVTFWI